MVVWPRSLLRIRFYSSSQDLPASHQMLQAGLLNTGFTLIIIILLSPVFGCGPPVSNEASDAINQSGNIVPNGESGMTPHPQREQGSIRTTNPSESKTQLQVPDWIQEAFNHPDVEVRLKAFDKWIELHQTDVPNDLKQSASSPSGGRIDGFRDLSANNKATADAVQIGQ